MYKSFEKKNINLFKTSCLPISKTLRYLADVHTHIQDAVTSLAIKLKENDARTTLLTRLHPCLIQLIASLHIHNNFRYKNYFKN